MLDQNRVFDELDKADVRFYAGVPDSYLNGFCNHALAHFPERTVIAANEGNAVGIAAGHWFATGELPLVYMQNSGLGNAVNPLASLADVRVYAVPMLLLVGWRGQGDSEPNHPQHTLQGEMTLKMLGTMHIPYTVLEDDDEAFEATLAEAVKTCRERRQAYGLIAPKGVMAAAEKANDRDASYPMSREEAMETILDHMPPDTIYCATTGRATRELFFLREKRGETKARDFLNVGAMGHASSVGLGIALARPERQVVVLDGDGAAMMHMGAMACKVDAPNCMHVVLNNGAHESVGGQPSGGHWVDFTKVAEGCGYATAGKAVENTQELVSALEHLRGCGRTSFIDCRVHKGLSRKLPPIVFDHRAAIDRLMGELNG